VDRDSIERRDFPTGRRGYDPAAVDEHLRRVADEFETQVRAPAPSMASSTSEQVRLILEAAERGASELRAAAGSEASDHVTRVQTAADDMLGKLDALESELDRLLGALRASGERLVEGLSELQAQAAAGLAPPDERRVDRAEPEQVGARAAEAPPAADDVPAPADAPLPTADTPPPAADDVPAPADAPPPTADAPLPTADTPPPAAAADAAPSAAADTPPPADAPTPPVADSPAAPAEPPSAHDSPPLSAPGAPDWPAPDAAPAGDTLFSPAEEDFAAASEPADAGARLIALNMALGGSSRGDTRGFLEEHFELPDVEALLDDVYARAGR